MHVWCRKITQGQVQVAHSCNPSYLGGRDQEDHSLKSAQANRNPILKKPISKKRAGGVAQGVGPEFKLLYQKKKKKREDYTEKTPE
jgi:hypothetical protein